PAAAPLARQYGERESATPETLRLARQVAAVAAVGDGRIDDALVLFDDHLKTIRLRSANEALEFATRLADELQLTDDSAAARAIYERVSERFFLNAAVREFCENKIDKLRLLGRVAPEVSLADFDGKPVDWAEYRGQVVLVDFWATNCPPCLD